MTAITILEDLRPHFGEARNQGSRPTCLAFAASDAHAALRPGWSPLSCEYTFYQAQQRASRPPDRGATLPAVLATVRHDGQPEEAGWPYLPAIPADLTAWLPPAEVGPRFGRAGAPYAHDVGPIIAEIDAQRPVILLMMLSRSFFMPRPDGVVQPAAGEAPEPARRHAVIAVGHGTVQAERALLVRNSWGPGWGLAGHAWLTEGFIAPRLFAAALLTEDVDVSASFSAA